jgi:hypothetical protein
MRPPLKDKQTVFVKKALNEQQIKKLKSTKRNIDKLNKSIDLLLEEAYNTLGVDYTSDSYQRDWIFDLLMNDGDFEVCLKNAGFEL